MAHNSAHIGYTRGMNDNLHNKKPYSSKHKNATKDIGI